jgi:polysaccharide chain length determinant protein (PEP-CTERM system associated)
VDENTLDLKDIVKVLKKRRKLICKVFLGFLAFAVIVSFIIPPTYEAETTLRVKQSKGLANSLLGDLGSMNPMGTKQVMSTYAEILKSRTVIQSVIDQTQQDKEEIPEYEDFIKTITTQPVKDTEILNIKVQAKTPEEAQLVANTLVNTFVDRLIALVRAEQSKVKEFIGDRLQDSKKELEAAEAALQQYKQNQKITAPTEETKALIEKLTAIDKLTADNQIAAETAKAKLASAKGQLANQKPGFIGENPVIQQYKLKLAELEVNLVGLMQNYTDKHPQVIATKAAIAETRSKLNAEIAKVVNADASSANPIHQGLLQAKLQAEAEVAVSTAQQQALRKLTAQGEEQIGKLPAKEQGLVKVMRDANVSQEIYVMLAKRYEEARISEVMEPTDVQIIDVAIAPDKPIKPKKLLNVVIAAILGLFTGTGLAFALEYLNKTVRTSEDVQQYLDLPVLGSIPAFDSEIYKDISMIDKVKQLFNSNNKQDRRA